MSNTELLTNSSSRASFMMHKSYKGYHWLIQTCILTKG